PADPGRGLPRDPAEVPGVPVPDPRRLAGDDEAATRPEHAQDLAQGGLDVRDVVDHRVPDDEVEAVVGEGEGLGIGDVAADGEAEPLGVLLRCLDHPRREVGDVDLLDQSGDLEVEREEPGAGPELEHPAEGQRLPRHPYRVEHAEETVPDERRAAVVEGDRPLLVVGLGLPVVVQHLGELVVLPGPLDVRHAGRRRAVGHQIPSKVALPGPFSMKLRMPVFWSCVAKSPAKAWASMSRPVPRSTSRPLSTLSFAARRAWAGPPTKGVTQRRAASRTSSGSTTSSASPIARASSAPTWRPVKIICLARAGPTSRGSRWVPPAPGMTPRVISGRPSLTLLATTRKS